MTVEQLINMLQSLPPDMEVQSRDTKGIQRQTVSLTFYATKPIVVIEGTQIGQY